MKTLLVTLLFFASSFAVASVDDSYSKRLSNTLAMAEDSLSQGDLDRFSLILNVALDTLAQTASSFQKETNIAEVQDLLDSAESSMSASAYEKLQSKINSL